MSILVQRGFFSSVAALNVPAAPPPEQTLEDIVGLEAHLWSFFAKDAPIGDVNSWTGAGTHGRTATASGENRPTKASADADVVFTGGQPHRMSWPGGDGNPSEPDATVAHRFGGFIAKITPSGAEYIDVGCINGTNGNANHRQPYVYAKGAEQKLGVMWYDSAFRFAEGTCEADAGAYQFLFWHRRGGKLFANVNGVWLTPVDFQSAAWNNVSAPSFIGAPSGNMTSTVGLGWWGMGQSEISDDVADQLVGLIARYAGREDLLVAADHPYAVMAPNLTEADFSSRYAHDEDAWQAFRSSNEQGSVDLAPPNVVPPTVAGYRHNHRGTSMPAFTGFRRRFFDDFKVDTLANNRTGEQTRNWMVPLDINPGANVNLGATNEQLSNSDIYILDPTGDGTMTIRMLYSGGKWRSGSMSTVMHDGFGRFFKTPSIYRALVKFVPSDGVMPGGYWPGFPWRYDPQYLKWRTRNRRELDDQESQGNSATFINITLHGAHPPVTAGSFTSPEVRTNDDFEKLAGYDLTVSRGFPAQLDWYDGAYKEIVFWIDDDYVYGYIDGCETFRDVTNQFFQGDWTVNFNAALKMQEDGVSHVSPAPSTSAHYDMVIDLMEVWQPEAAFEVVPEAGFTARPTISGTPITGQVLTATPNAVATRTGQIIHRWYRDDGSTVLGASAATYTPNADDVGFRLRYEAINTGVNNQPVASSDFTDVIGSATGPWLLNNLEDVGDLKFNFSAVDHASMGSPSDGAAVSGWADLGPEARHASQATSGKRPTYVVASDINGQPALRFVGANDCAMTFSAPGAGGDALRYGGTGNAYLLASVLGGGTTTAQSSVIALNSAYITLFAWTTTHHYWFINGTLVADAASSNPNSGMIWSVHSADSQGGGGAARLIESGVIGNRSSATGRAWDGDIGAEGCWIGDWDDALRQRVDGRLAWDFLMTGVLPGGHNHKAEEPMLDGGGGGPVTTWDPANKGASITLSNSNLDATNSAGAWNSVQSTTSKAAGKLYAEFLIDQTPSDKSTQLLGFGQSIDLNNYLTNAGDTAGVRGNGQLLTKNGISAGGGSRPSMSIASGDVVQLAIDFTAKKAWWGLSGDWGNGSPGSGANAHATWSIDPTLFLGYANDSGGACRVTLRTHASQFTQVVPSGFTGWDV